MAMNCELMYVCGHTMSWSYILETVSLMSTAAMDTSSADKLLYFHLTYFNTVYCIVCMYVSGSKSFI